MRKKKVYLSVIIPAYNASVAVTRLLSSLRKSRYKDFEVIIGDDASEEPIGLVCQDVISRSKFPITIVRLKKNHGPAGARNYAAQKAKGNVIVFLDADVEVYPDTLSKIAGYFKSDDDLTALTGVWDKEQRTNRFFPQFKALRDWSYWTNERDRDGYYYLFSTRIAALRRKVFERLGGFNVAFRQMEDVEITYRIARRYAIIFASDVKVHHEFEELWPVAKKYFWRSVYWSKLWRARKKFDPVATTMWETLAALTGVGSVALFLLGIGIYFLIPSQVVKQITLLGSVILLLFHWILLRKFLTFVYKEKGLLFTIEAFVVGLFLYTVILSGAMYYNFSKKLLE